jgi:hypothetical protein
MSDLVDDLCGLRIHTGSRDGIAYTLDATYHQEFTRLRQAMNAIDDALVASGMEPAQREYILTVVLHGPPSAAAAETRIARQRDVRAKLMASGQGSASSEIPFEVDYHLLSRDFELKNARHPAPPGYVWSLGYDGDQRRREDFDRLVPLRDGGLAPNRIIYVGFTAVGDGEIPLAGPPDEPQL